jgi:transposase-like protein
MASCARYGGAEMHLDDAVGLEEQVAPKIAKDIRPMYSASTEAAAKERFVEFTAKWGGQYPAIIRLWENAWSEFVPFLDYGVCRRITLASSCGLAAPGAA